MAAGAGASVVAGLLRQYRHGRDRPRADRSMDRAAGYRGAVCRTPLAPPRHLPVLHAARAGDRRPAAARAGGGRRITFGSFNNLSKVNAVRDRALVARARRRARQPPVPEGAATRRALEPFYDHRTISRARRRRRDACCSKAVRRGPTISPPTTGSTSHSIPSPTRAAPPVSKACGWACRY